jgi:hypothetical protein
VAHHLVKIYLFHPAFHVVAVLHLSRKFNLVRGAPHLEHSPLHVEEQVVLPSVLLFVTALALRVLAVPGAVLGQNQIALVVNDLEVFALVHVRHDVVFGFAAAKIFNFTVFLDLLQLLDLFVDDTHVVRSRPEIAYLALDIFSQRVFLRRPLSIIDVELLLLLLFFYHERSQKVEIAACDRASMEEKVVGLPKRGRRLRAFAHYFLLLVHSLGQKIHHSFVSVGPLAAALLELVLVLVNEDR